MSQVERCRKIVSHLYELGLSKRLVTKIMNLVLDKLDLD